MKIIFFGSDDFALVSLEQLAQTNQIVCCVTPPDKPKGRKLELQMSPIKEWAGRNNIPVLQPGDLKAPDFLKTLKDFQADIFVVIAYGRILPIEVLSIPYLCCMNVHGSLLPKYRGAAPINWAIMNGDKETGVSIIKMNTGMDAGDIFAQSRIKITDEDTSVTLRARMAKLGAELLVKTVDSLEKNAYTLQKQDRSLVTSAPKLTKELGLINWNKEAAAIHNLVRGLLPWPGAYTYFKGKMIKVLQTQIHSGSAPQRSPGEIVGITKEGLVVAALQSAIVISYVQPESGKSMDAKSFVVGYKAAVGDYLS